MIQFANPAMLWLLGGVLLPILIHLLSRKEGQLIRMGSIRHLQETPTSRFRGIKLNEILLLALRALIIALLVLFMSGLSIRNNNEAPSDKWLVLEKGIESEVLARNLIDSLLEDGYALHYLAAGFPADPQEVVSTPDYRRLADELQDEKVSAIILSYGRTTGFKGSATRPGENLRWINLPRQKESRIIATATGDDNTIIIRRAHFTDTLTYLENFIENDPQGVAASTDTIRVNVYAEKGYEQDKQMVLAALQAIKSKSLRPIIVSNITEIDTRERAFLINLSEPRSRSKNSINLVPSNSLELVKENGTNGWAITKRLNPDIALDGNLAVRLMQILVTDPSIESEIDLHDSRMVDNSLAWKDGAGGGKEMTGDHYAKIDSIIMILLVMTIVVERIVAFSKRL